MNSIWEIFETPNLSSEEEEEGRSSLFLEGIIYLFIYFCWECLCASAQETQKLLLTVLYQPDGHPVCQP